ncbi:hypothetical protein C5167_025039 [Papaver somniferum]|uniref:Uncharacterized protein n=1 Tax=Papaver somniferum TaxID=3469 RepID=A0A4Y7JRD0_PAPSO|nr:hypothetical protein C5167_025039 [Papaver somniferum]
MILAVMAEAEKSHETDGTCKTLAYDIAEDVVGEFSYETMRKSERVKEETAKSIS